MLCSATYRYNDHHFQDAVPKISVKFSGGYFSDRLLVSSRPSDSRPFLVYKIESFIQSMQSCGMHSIFFGLSRLCVFAFRRSSVLLGCNRDCFGPGAVSEDSRTAGATYPGASSRGHHDGRDKGFGVPPSAGGGVFGEFDGRAIGEASSIDSRAGRRCGLDWRACSTAAA